MSRHEISFEQGDVVYYITSGEDPDTFAVHNMDEEILQDIESDSRTEIYINSDKTTLEEVEQKYGEDVARGLAPGFTGE